MAPRPGEAIGVSDPLETPLTRHAGVEVPLICGPMYPCSNPELVAAASEAGGLGVLQPVSLTYVFGYDFREGVRRIRELTGRPIGMNADGTVTPITLPARFGPYLCIGDCTRTYPNPPAASR